MVKIQHLKRLKSEAALLWSPVPIIKTFKFLIWKELTHHPPRSPASLTHRNLKLIVYLPKIFSAAGPKLGPVVLLTVHVGRWFISQGIGAEFMGNNGAISVYTIQYTIRIRLYVYIYQTWRSKQSGQTEHTHPVLFPNLPWEVRVLCSRTTPGADLW